MVDLVEDGKFIKNVNKNGFSIKSLSLSFALLSGPLRTSSSAHVTSEHCQGSKELQDTQP